MGSEMCIRDRHRELQALVGQAARAEQVPAHHRDPGATPRSPTTPSPTSTSRSPTRSTPSTPRPNRYPPTPSDPRWRGYAASTTASSALSLHPTRRAGLRVRVDLRELRLLPDQHRVPAHPPSPTRRRRRQRPRPPRRPLRTTPRRPHGRRSIMTSEHPDHRHNAADSESTIMAMSEHMSGCTS